MFPQYQFTVTMYNMNHMHCHSVIELQNNIEGDPNGIRHDHMHSQFAVWLSGYRTSVFGWKTFPDLWSMTCDRFVGKVSAVGQPTRPTQSSIPWGPVND